MKPQLRLANEQLDPIVTRAEIEMARIDQEHREYHSTVPEVSNPGGWKPYKAPESGYPALDVGKAVNRQYRVVVSAPVPWWRKILNIITNLKGKIK